jgi:L-lactate dehydrogenase complex protein LldG
MAAVSAAKENILKRIRKALTNQVPLPFPLSEGTHSVYTPRQDDDAITFAEEFTKLQGKFAFCLNEEDLKEQLFRLVEKKSWTKIYCVEDNFLSLLELSPGKDLAGCDVSITGCEYLVARTGSIVMSAAEQSGRTSSVYAPIHICIAYKRQLLYEVKDALGLLKERYKNNFPSFVTFATGPSRTADIEKTLVTGVHGPKEVYCFLVEEG